MQPVCSDFLEYSIKFLENPLENDENLSYFPSINNPNTFNRPNQTFSNGSNNNGGNMFNDILPNPNPNPISTLSTNTFLNNRQQPYKPVSTMTFPPQAQIRNDENVYHTNHPYANSVRISFDQSD